MFIFNVALAPTYVPKPPPRPCLRRRSVPRSSDLHHGTRIQPSWDMRSRLGGPRSFCALRSVTGCAPNCALSARQRRRRSAAAVAGTASRIRIDQRLLRVDRHTVLNTARILLCSLSTLMGQHADFQPNLSVCLRACRATRRPQAISIGSIHILFSARLTLWVGATAPLMRTIPFAMSETVTDRDSDYCQLL